MELCMRIYVCAWWRCWRWNLACCDGLVGAKVDRNEEVIKQTSSAASASIERNPQRQAGCPAGRRIYRQTDKARQSELQQADAGDGWGVASDMLFFGAPFL